jgi:hypothetical protein
MSTRSGRSLQRAIDHAKVEHGSEVVMKHLNDISQQKTADHTGQSPGHQAAVRVAEAAGNTTSNAKPTQTFGPGTGGDDNTRSNPPGEAAPNNTPSDPGAPSTTVDRKQPLADAALKNSSDQPEPKPAYTGEDIGTPTVVSQDQPWTNARKQAKTRMTVS